MPAFKIFKGKCFICNVMYEGSISYNKNGFCSLICHNEYLEKKYSNGSNTRLKKEGLCLRQFSSKYVEPVDYKKNIPGNKRMKQIKISKDDIPFWKQIKLKINEWRKK